MLQPLDSGLKPLGCHFCRRATAVDQSHSVRALVEPPVSKKTLTAKHYTLYTNEHQRHIKKIKKYVAKNSETHQTCKGLAPLRSKFYL